MPFYVGKGRPSRAKQLRRSRNKHHQAIVDKYGEDNIQVFSFPCSSEEEAMQDEKQQIAQLRRDGYSLCNMTDGGDGFTGGRHTEESRRRIGAAAKGNQFTLGVAPPNKGKPMAPEVYARYMANRPRGFSHSDETRAKMSAAHAGQQYYNNGLVERRWRQEDVQPGFVKGRLATRARNENGTFRKIK